MPNSQRGALEELKGLLAECVSGSGRLVVASGGPISGKTTLLKEFLDVSRGTDAVALRATGAPAERLLSGAMLHQLFTAADLPGDVANRAMALLGAAAGDADADRPGDGDAGTVAGMGAVQAIVGLLLDLAKDRTLVIGIDDVQFADLLTLRVISQLHRRMVAKPVMIVLCGRDEPQPPPFYPWAEIVSHADRRIRIDPLSTAEIGERLRRSLPEQLADGLAPDFHRLTNGNVMLVHALIEDYLTAAPHRTQDDTAYPEPVVGAAFREAIRTCLHRNEPQLLDVVRAVAVLGDRAEPVLVAALTNVPADVVTRAVASLTRAGLLRGYRFRHQDATAAALDDMPPVQRSALHHQAAELLYQAGADAGQVAEHILAAGHVVSGWQIGVLSDAAEEALARGSTAVAERCLKVALAATKDPADRAALSKTLARVLWHTNPLAGARHMAPHRPAILGGHLTARDAVTVARYGLWYGDKEAASTALDALRACTGQVDPQTISELQWTYHLFHNRAGGGPLDNQGPGKSGGDPWVGVLHKLGTVWTRGGSDAVTVSAEHVLQSCRLGDTAEDVVITAFFALLSNGRTGLARSWCDQLTADADRRGATTWQALLGCVRAEIALLRGEFEPAAATANTSMDLLPAQGWGVSIAYPLTTLLLSYTAMRRFDLAAEVLEQPVPDALFTTVTGLRYLYARGHYYLAAQQILAAANEFQKCARLMQEWHLEAPVLVPWRIGLAEANLQLGRRAVARDLIKQQLDRSDALDDRTRGIALRVLAISSDIAYRPESLRRAVECLEASNDRFELGRALTNLSETYQELGELEKARTLARRASQELIACNVSTLATPSRRSTTPDTRSAPADADQSLLSEAERRVAVLAARGHTNREISRRLYITVSTVEQHLTRLYRKLGVRNRAELPVELARAEERLNGARLDTAASPGQDRPSLPRHAGKEPTRLLRSA